MGNTADIEYRGHLARIQRQVVALLPRYCLSDKLLKQVSSTLILNKKILALTLRGIPATLAC